jgi:hypothetical protein
MLVKFFGDKYLDYCKHSYIGIPFIASIHLKNNKSGSTVTKVPEDK